MDLKEMACGGDGLDRSGLGKGQLADTCECGLFSYFKRLQQL
jgi:hypothetical protein